MSPVQVLSITDATAITTGSINSCALHLTGTISCWGNNEFGQVGNGQSGRNERSLVPAQVLSITDATAITTGWGHSCALHQDGTISCWGGNDYGQLGNGTTRNRSVVPVKVVGITDATAITADVGHSCALHQTGAISCWGRNVFGQLGNGTRTGSSVPVQVTGITDATAITTGGGLDGYTCALHQTGAISCWGVGIYGQLGDGNSASSVIPVQVTDITDATAITSSVWHSCALHQDGTISCWGRNGDGQLGNVTYADSSVPVRVFGITDATAINAGSGHSCALRRDGTISCWGRNNFGQLGNGQSGRNVRSPAPVRVTGFGG